MTAPLFSAVGPLTATPNISVVNIVHLVQYLMSVHYIYVKHDISYAKITNVVVLVKTLKY